MKKTLILLLISAIAPSFADVNTRYQTDLELESCLEKSENYIQKIQCNDRATEKYAKEIDEALKDMKEILPQAEYKALLESQQKWEDYIEQTLILLSRTLENDFDHELLYASSSIKCSNFKDRAMDIMYIYYNLKYIKK